MDIEKLKVVVEYLREHLEDASLRMDDWIIEDDRVSACGTAGCLAWHTVKALEPEYEANRTDSFFLTCSATARRLLKMTESERTALFFYGAWPLPDYAYVSAYSLDQAKLEMEEERTRRIENMRTLIRLLDEVIRRGEVWWR